MPVDVTLALRVGGCLLGIKMDYDIVIVEEDAKKTKIRRNKYFLNKRSHPVGH